MPEEPLTLSYENKLQVAYISSARRMMNLTDTAPQYWRNYREMERAKDTILKLSLVPIDPGSIEADELLNRWHATQITLGGN